MKKHDVRDMVDGIGEEYIAEAVERAMNGTSAASDTPQPAERTLTGTAGTETVTTAKAAMPDQNDNTPFFMTKRAILALTAVAAVTVFAVGMVLREAFPRGNVLDPANSGSSSPDSIDTEISAAVSSAAESSDAEVPELWKMGTDGKNMLGGEGEFRLIGTDGFYNELAFADDTRVYIRQNGDLYYAEKPEYFDNDNMRVDLICEETVTLRHLFSGTNGLHSDGKYLYMQHNKSLYRITDTGETLVTDFHKEGNSAETFFFNVDAVRRVNDDVLFLFDSGSGRVASVNCKTGSAALMFTNESLPPKERPISNSEAFFSFSEDYVWFKNAENSLSNLHYTGTDYTLNSYPVSGDALANAMEGRLWFAVGSDLYYTNFAAAGEEEPYDRASNYLMCYSTEKNTTTQAADLSLVYEMEQGGSTIYAVCEKTGSAGEIAVDGIRRYALDALRLDGSSERGTVCEQYSYGASPYAQSEVPISLLNANDRYVVYSSGGAYHFYNGTYQFAAVTEEMMPSAESIEIVGDIMPEYCTVRLNQTPVMNADGIKDRAVKFNPVFKVMNPNGEELPNTEQENRPTATWFRPQTASNETLYPFPTYGPVYLRLCWADWYGILGAGDYIIQIKTYTNVNEIILREVKLHIEGDAGSGTDQQTNIDAGGNIAASMENITDSGCTVTYTNTGTTEHAWYGEAYYIHYNFDPWEGARYSICAGGEQSTFIEIAHELQPGESVSREIKWQDFYGKLLPGKYYMELAARYSNGKSIWLFFTVNEDGTGTFTGLQDSGE